MPCDCAASCEPQGANVRLDYLPIRPLDDEVIVTINIKRKSKQPSARIIVTGPVEARKD